MSNKFLLTAPSEREVLALKYRNARYNLLAVALVTLINVILAATASDSYFLFGATIPYIITLLTALYCGLYPPEYYGAEYSALEFYPMGVFYIGLAIALVIVGLYVLAFFLSNKKRVGWMIFALVLFCLDTLALIWYFGISPDWILDYVFHAWIIVILSLGIRNHFKMTQLPEEPIAPPAFQELNEEVENSVPLRAADMTVKHKVFLEVTVNGKHVIYRRVKRVNELVINGQVYDEYVALVEFAHTLSAVLDGHLYQAGMLAANRSFIAVDGQQLASKIRLI